MEQGVHDCTARRARNQDSSNLTIYSGVTQTWDGGSKHSKRFRSYEKTQVPIQPPPMPGPIQEKIQSPEPHRVSSSALLNSNLASVLRRRGLSDLLKSKLPLVYLSELPGCLLQFVCYLDRRCLIWPGTVKGIIRQRAEAILRNFDRVAGGRLVFFVRKVP